MGKFFGGFLGVMKRWIVKVNLMMLLVDFIEIKCIININVSYEY